MIVALMQILDNKAWGDKYLGEALAMLGDLENLIRENKGLA